MCACIHDVCVGVLVGVDSVIAKSPVLPHCVVDGLSRNPLYYYYYGGRRVGVGMGVGVGLSLLHSNRPSCVYPLSSGLRDPPQTSSWEQRYSLTVVAGCLRQQCRRDPCCRHWWNSPWRFERWCHLTGTARPAV